MSETVVFKKKSRRNFRKKNIDEEREQEEETEETVEEQKTEQKPEEKPKKASKAAPSALLSFDHGDEDSTEVFKVKKSKESRRLSKQRVKAKKTKDNEPEEKTNTTEPEKIDNEKLESLREELSYLGGGDDDDDVDSAENGGGKVIKSDGIIFKPLPVIQSKDSSFQIPDAAAIHAARKRREMARQMGSEYVPLDDTDRYGGRFDNTDKSRLIREDDNDNSDDDPDTPLGFGTKKSNTHPGLQRRLEVEKALANDSEDDEKSEGEDDALRRFEEEQIRKGVSIPQAQQEEESNVYQLYVQQQLLYGNSADPNYTQTANTHYDGLGIPMPSYQQSNYPPLSLNSVSMDMVWEKLNNRIVSLQEVNRGRRLEKEKMTSQMESCDESIISLEKQLRDAEGRYGFFQEMRGYVRDLIECLNEKVRQ